MIASQTGGMFTYNECADYFYGLPPIAAWDERGWKIADNSFNRDPLMFPATFAPRDEAEANQMSNERKAREAKLEKQKDDQAAGALKPQPDPVIKSPKAKPGKKDSGIATL